ncbi:MAG: ferritin family protein [Candidatus Cloacimonetes bacterium]|nr:ferritin family protein [Candidatus Cloacimonadota bacterium]
MQSSSKHIKLAIGAIQLEIDGRNFFLKAVEMSHNKLGKKMFQKLADDELRHLTDFKNIFSSIIKGEDWDKLVESETSKTISPVIKELTSRLEKAGSASEIEAIKIGMELERKAIHFFEDFTKELDDAQTKEIVLNICDEERFHYDLLQSQYDSVTNSGFWLDVAEFSMDARF